MFRFWGLAIASYSRCRYSFYLAWGLQSDQHTGLRGGSDKTKGSSGHRPHARSSFSPAHIDCTLWRIHRKTLWLSLAFFFICASITSVGTWDFLLAPAHWGSAWLSFQSKPSIFLLSEQRGRWARQRTELEAVHLGNGTARPHLWNIWTAILELLFLVCSLHSCLKCLIKLYKLYFVVLCGCSPFGSWCWISKLMWGKR